MPTSFVLLELGSRRQRRWSEQTVHAALRSTKSALQRRRRSKATWRTNLAEDSHGNGQHAQLCSSCATPHLWFSGTYLCFVPLVQLSRLASLSNCLHAMYK